MERQAAEQEDKRSKIKRFWESIDPEFNEEILDEMYNEGDVVEFEASSLQQNVQQRCSLADFDDLIQRNHRPSI